MRRWALFAALVCCCATFAVEVRGAEPPRPSVSGRGIAAAAIGLETQEVVPPAVEPEQPESTPAFDDWQEPIVQDPEFHGPTRVRLLLFVRSVPMQRCNGRSCWLDTSEKLASASQVAVCNAMTAGGWKVNGKGDGHVHLVDVDEHPDAARAWGITTTPMFVLTHDEREVCRKPGALTMAQIAELYSSNAATFRPAGDGWRARLPRSVSSSVHTTIEAGKIELPKTSINIAAQAIEFIDSKESRINEWFSVLFNAGEISHTGSKVTFSAPPQLRLQLPFGKSIELDALHSIEFVAGGANFHLARIGTIPFRP